MCLSPFLSLSSSLSPSLSLTLSPSRRCTVRETTLTVWMVRGGRTAAELREHNFKAFKDFHLKATAVIWP